MRRTTTTTTRRRAPAIRVYRENPPGRRVTLGHTVRGRELERVVGPRGRLTLAEAAAVLDRPAAEMRKDIRAGFLRALRDRGQVVVTLAACDRFLREEREDGEDALAALEAMRRTGQRPIPLGEFLRSRRLG